MDAQAEAKHQVDVLVHLVKRLPHRGGCRAFARRRCNCGQAAIQAQVRRLGEAIGTERAAALARDLRAELEGRLHSGNCPVTRETGLPIKLYNGDEVITHQTSHGACTCGREASLELLDALIPRL